jgi:hypothetical protein
MSRKARRLSLQLFAQHEGNPVVPGQAEFGGGLAGGDVLLDFLAFQRVAHVADGGLAVVGGAQFQVAVDGEAGRGFAGLQPFGHRGAG